MKRLLRRLPGSSLVDRGLTHRPDGAPPLPGALRPVVYLPTWLCWDVMPQRPQSLLAALAAAGHPVYFVDPRERAVRTDREVTIVPSLRTVPARSVLLYVHYAPSAGPASWFSDSILVYDVLDDLSMYAAKERGLPKAVQTATHHPRLLRSAEVVIASSRMLADGLRAERPDVVLVENGVDPARFGDPLPRPSDLPPGPPIVGYHGAIAPWFDFALFAEVATGHPEWRFFLVGPVDPEVRDEVDRVSRLLNVFVVGERPGSEMPAYVQAFDVGAVWFLVSDLTRAVSPLKVFECLAASVPVVSTPLPACLEIDGVVVASSPAEFGAAIGAALASPDRRRLRMSAEAAAWPRRVYPLLEQLDARGFRRAPG